MSAGRSVHRVHAGEGSVGLKASAQVATGRLFVGENYAKKPTQHRRVDLRAGRDRTGLLGAGAGALLFLRRRRA